MEGGEATLWEAQQIFTGQDDSLTQHFIEQADASYGEILNELEADDPDLAALAKRYHQTKRQDYFQSEIGEEVRQLLVERRGSDSI